MQAKYRQKRQDILSKKERYFIKKRHIQNQIQEKGRISSTQLSFLAITLIISTADVFLPAFVAQEAGRDSWIAVVIGTLSSIAVINIFLSLGLKYPDKTIIQYSCDILGKPLGKLVGFFYIYYFIFTSSSVTRELGEILIVSFNPDAPLMLYNLTTVLVAAYSVLKGLEVIARVNEMLLPVGLGILAFTAAANIHNMDFNNFLPILYNGPVPLLKGAVLIQGWLVETVILLQFIPFVKDRQNIRKGINISVVTLGVSMEIGVLTIAIFGSLTGKLLFPALEYVRMASLGPYLENLDISIMVVWVAGIFIKMTVMYYAVVLGISQLFSFKSYMWMIVPTGTVILCFSITSFKMLMNMLFFAKYIFPFYSFAMSFAIPLMLLAVSAVRDRTAQGSKPVPGV